MAHRVLRPIQQLVNLHPWQCDKVTVSFSSHGELSDGSHLYREAHLKQMIHSEVIS